MAKKAVSVVEKQSKDRDIQREFGRVISSGTELLQIKKERKAITVSPALDLALNGGILEGCWTLIAGEPKSGKSTTCLQICANAQAMGKPVIYLDVEDKLEAYNLEGIQGLDRDNFTIIHPPREEGESLSAEDFLNIASSLIKKPEYKGAVLVIDSCSDLLPRSEMDADTSGSLRATLPKMLTHWIKKTSQDIAKTKVLVLVIQHYITNTSGYGKLKNPDGGQELQYKAATRMDIYKTEPWLEGDKKIGQIVHWKISCSSMGASGTECVSYIRFGKGVDKEKEIIELAEAFSIIEKAGAWYSIPFLAGNGEFEEAPKFQGQSKIYDFLVERKDIFDQIKNKVNEMVNG
jgi:recombination protein RecA